MFEVKSMLKNIFFSLILLLQTEMVDFSLLTRKPNYYFEIFQDKILVNDANLVSTNPTKKFMI